MQRLLFKYFRHMLLLSLAAVTSIAQAQYVTFQGGKGAFTLSSSGKSATLYASSTDYPGVIRALQNFRTDVTLVTGAAPTLLDETKPLEREIVIAGTIGKGGLIDQLVQKKKIDVSTLTGKWETFLVQVVEKPFPNVDRALVIAGSDKRGTIFGIYDLSRQIGVSPWYWWADVPPRKSSALYVQPGRHIQGEPAVRYRGIFINDEEPALGRWAVEKYGGFTHAFYEKVFDLILRLKGNYLWPAMWWASFNSDDTLNPSLADEYGVVIGTTHHEPMNRAHAEWRKGGVGAWNYETNETVLRNFWTDGIRRMGDRETIVSLGMRGDGDMAMTQETNIALLQRIVRDQREILKQETGKDVTATPQLWALYKEVQDYYDKGMRAPDDVTLLLCDDNWGNIRKLPRPDDSARSGSYGIYYHFDYVGGPRNYKWLNTNPIARVWEQMHLAYRFGANRIWIVNVGDIKPMEFPIEFFLDYAWNPESIPHDKLGEYTKKWAAEQFGQEHAASIANILTAYAKFNGRRKPELLSAETYSLINYGEADRIVSEYNALAEEANRIYKALPAEQKDAYYQLILYPVAASANLNELWVTVGKNRLNAKQGRASANYFAEKARTLFAKDAEMSNYYNKTLSNGKWNHMADQTHISYTYWQQPQKDELPEVKVLEVPAAAEMGIAVEGSDVFWASGNQATLPSFGRFGVQDHYFEIFNRGKAPFDFSIKVKEPWLTVSSLSGKVEQELRIKVTVDWKRVPPGSHDVPVEVSGPDGKVVTVHALVNNPSDQPAGFVESNGYVSIEAAHFTRAVDSKGIQWKPIPDLGRTLSGVTTFPVTSKPAIPGKDSPHLEYEIYLFTGGEVSVEMYLSPTLNFHNTAGLRYAVSLDDEAPQLINLHEGTSNQAWEKWVSDNVIVKTSKHTVAKPGRHVLRFWTVDAGVVLQKLVVKTRDIGASYLGPPESTYIPTQKKKPVSRK